MAYSARICASPRGRANAGPQSHRPGNRKPFRRCAQSIQGQVRHCGGQPTLDRPERPFGPGIKSMSFSSGGQRQRWSFACREIRLARRAIPACGNALGKASWRTGIRFAWPFLFQREAFELRKLVFKRVRVTGVMNFAALRLDNKLWSTNDAPFVLFVARNEPSAPNDNFYYISPRYRCGVIRPDGGRRATHRGHSRHRIAIHGCKTESQYAGHGGRTRYLHRNVQSPRGAVSRQRPRRTGAYRDVKSHRGLGLH